MKTKYLDKRQWRRLKHSSYKEVITKYKKTRVLISCLYIEEVYQPLIVNIIGEKIKVADNHYKWITLMPENSHYSMTVMYDETEQPIQYYFDINKSHTLEIGNAQREDMYLDVLALPDGRSEIVDEDDVLRALKNNKMTAEDRDFAYRIAYQIQTMVQYKFDQVKEAAMFAYRTIMERNT